MIASGSLSRCCRRNAIASQMLAMLEDATFDRQEFNEENAEQLIEAAQQLLNKVMGTKEAGN